MSVIPSFLAPVLKPQPNATSSATASSKLPLLDRNVGTANTGGLLSLSNHKMLQLGKILSKQRNKPLRNHGRKLLSADGAPGEAGAKDSPPMVAWRIAAPPALSNSTSPVAQQKHNVEALFRRAQASVDLKDYEAAIKDLKLLLQQEGESNNDEAKRLLAVVQRDQKEEDKKQMIMYSNMYSDMCGERSGRFDRGAPARQASALPSKLAPLPASENLEPENLEPMSDNEDYDEEEEQCISMAIAPAEIQFSLRIHVPRDMKKLLAETM